jgi:hypothetical protein
MVMGDDTMALPKPEPGHDSMVSDGRGDCELGIVAGGLDGESGDDVCLCVCVF